MLFTQLCVSDKCYYARGFRGWLLTQYSDRDHKMVLERFSQLPIDDQSRVIEMAWEDRTPFEAIDFQFGFTEKDVIQIMQCHLKITSFRNWRRRVSGRAPSIYRYVAPMFYVAIAKPSTKYERRRKNNVEIFQKRSSGELAESVWPVSRKSLSGTAQRPYALVFRVDGRS